MRLCSSRGQRKPSLPRPNAGSTRTGCQGARKHEHRQAKHCQPRKAQRHLSKMPGPESPYSERAGGVSVILDEEAIRKLSVSGRKGSNSIISTSRHKHGRSDLQEVQLNNEFCIFGVHDICGAGEGMELVYYGQGLWTTQGPVCY